MFHRPDLRATHETVIVTEIVYENLYLWIYLYEKLAHQAHSSETAALIHTHDF